MTNASLRTASDIRKRCVPGARPGMVSIAVFALLSSVTASVLRYANHRKVIPTENRTKRG